SLHPPSPPPDPNTARATPRPQKKSASQIDFLHLNLRDLVNTQLQLRSVLDVPRFADIPVDAGIVVGTPAGLQALHRAIPNRPRVLARAFLVDNADLQPVDRYRIGAEHHQLGIKPEFALERERPAVPYAAQSVHNLQHRARPQRLRAGQRSDERIG